MRMQHVLGPMERNAQLAGYGIGSCPVLQREHACFRHSSLLGVAVLCSPRRYQPRLDPERSVGIAAGVGAQDGSIVRQRSRNKKFLLLVIDIGESSTGRRLNQPSQPRRGLEYAADGGVPGRLAFERLNGIPIPALTHVKTRLAKLIDDRPNLT